MRGAFVFFYRQCDACDDLFCLLLFFFVYIDIFPEDRSAHVDVHIIAASRGLSVSRDPRAIQRFYQNIRLHARRAGTDFHRFHSSHKISLLNYLMIHFNTDQMKIDIRFNISTV